MGASLRACEVSWGVMMMTEMARSSLWQSILGPLGFFCVLRCCRNFSLFYRGSVVVLIQDAVRPPEIYYSRAQHTKQKKEKGNHSRPPYLLRNTATK